MSEAIQEVSLITEGSSPSEANPIQLPVSCVPPSSSFPVLQSVWIVFGARGHLGHSLIQHVLSQRDLVSVVGQSSEDTHESLQGFHSQPYLSLLCDIRVRSTVENAINRTLEEYGRIDVVVSFSSFGVVGACEDQSELLIRGQFERNFLGTLNIIQASLPLFRQRRAGRFILPSTACAGLGTPGLGPYSAIKCAVESLIESMVGEIDPLGIKATLIDIGLSQENDATVSSHPASLISIPPSESYGGVNSPPIYAERMIAHLKNYNPVNPASCAELIWQLAHCQYPPLKLPLGSFAVESCRDKLRSLVEEIEDWEFLNFPARDKTP